jgi:hypothetical protein
MRLKLRNLAFLGALAGVWALVGCQGAAVTPTPPSPPPASVTITIGSQPQGQSVVAGQPVTFVVTASSSNGDALSYAWAVLTPGSKTSAAIGTDSNVLNIPGASVTTAMSGAQFQVTISLVDDAPAVSNAATLTVTPAAPPPSGSQTPNPGFVTATPFPASMGATPSTTVTVPSVSAGILAVCFYVNMTPDTFQTFLSASGAVTDTSNDAYTLYEFTPIATQPGDTQDNNDTSGICYGAPVAAGANVVVTVNLPQGAGSTFGGVVLNYTGLQGKVDGSSENNGLTSATGTPTTDVESGGTVVENLANELILAVSVQAGNQASGNGFTQRWIGPTCNCSTSTAMVVEDAIGPVTVPGATPVVFYTTSAGVPFDATAVSIY